MPEKVLKDILKMYDLELKNSILCKGGFNKNYIVNTDNGKYFLKERNKKGVGRPI